MSTYYFKPWKGKFFETNNKIGKKLLIIEESHYNFSQEPESSDFLINTISKYLSNFDDTTECKEFDEITDSLKKINESLSNEDIWESIAYTTFAQIPKAHPLNDPDYFSDFETYFSATDAYWEYLDDLLPDGIIVLGNRVQYLVPHDGYNFDKKIPAIDENGDNYIIGYYRFENYKSIGFICARHPQEKLNTKLFSKAVKIFTEELSKFDNND